MLLVKKKNSAIKICVVFHLYLCHVQIVITIDTVKFRKIIVVGRLI